MAFQARILLAVLIVGVIVGGCVPVHEAPTSLDGEPTEEPATEAATDASATALPTATDIAPTATPQICSAYRILFTKGDSAFYSVCFDDRQIYFESLVSPTLDVPSRVVTNGTYIVLLNLDGVSLYDLANHHTTPLDEFPNIEDTYWSTLSPGAEYIAYSVFVQEPNVSNQRKLLIAHIPTETLSPAMSSQSLGFSEFENFLYPTWSPNGEQIALQDGDMLTGYILTVQCQADTHQCLPEEAPRMIPLPENIAIRSPISWSPDGSELAAVCGHREDARLTICVFNSDGDILREFDASALGLRGLDIVNWSPDGSLLAFHALDTSTRRLNIHIINAADMTAYTTLSSESDNYQYPVWVP
jgi:hypothetical protein